MSSKSSPDEVRPRWALKDEETPLGNNREARGPPRQLREQGYQQRGKRQRGAVITCLEPLELVAPDRHEEELGLQRGGQPEAAVRGEPAQLSLL